MWCFRTLYILALSLNFPCFPITTISLSDLMCLRALWSAISRLRALLRLLTVCYLVAIYVESALLLIPMDFSLHYFSFLSTPTGLFRSTLRIMPTGHWSTSLLLVFLMPTGFRSTSLLLFLMPTGFWSTSLLLFLMPTGFRSTSLLFLMPTGFRSTLSSTPTGFRSTLCIMPTGLWSTSPLSVSNAYGLRSTFIAYRPYVRYSFSFVF